MKGSGFISTTGAGSIPAGFPKSGTLRSSGVNVQASSGVFTKDMEGSYIFSGGQVRLIAAFLSATSVRTEAAFSPAIAGNTWEYIPKEDCGFSSYEVLNNGANPGKVCFTLSPVSDLDKNVSVSGASGPYGPIAYDATGTTFLIQYER